MKEKPYSPEEFQAMEAREGKKDLAQERESISEQAVSNDDQEYESIVIEEATEEDLRQARQLLTDLDLDKLSDDERQEIETASLEVNEALETEKSLEHFRGAIAELRERKEQARERGEFPVAEVLGSCPDLRNGRMTLIDTGDNLRCTFSLQPEKWREVLARVEGQAQQMPIRFESAQSNEQVVTFDQAVGWNEGKATIQLATEQEWDDSQVTSIDGLVVIDLPGFNASSDDDAVFADLNKALGGKLELSETMQSPNESTERQQAAEQYAKQHRTETDALPDNVSRQELFAGFSSFVESGRHQEYSKDSPLLLTHRIDSGPLQKVAWDRIVGIMSGSGLMSTMERLRRGKIVEGISSGADIRTGGGDSVFTRLVTRNAANQAPGLFEKGYTLLMGSESLDRTDWYAYEEDRFGSQDPAFFDNRPTPEQFVAQENQQGRRQNEVMFERGIDAQQNVVGISCPSESGRKMLLMHLKRSGITEVGGKSVEEAVYVARDRREWFDRAYGADETTTEPADTPTLDDENLDQWFS